MDVCRYNKITSGFGGCFYIIIRKSYIFFGCGYPVMVTGRFSDGWISYL